MPTPEPTGGAGPVEFVDHEHTRWRVQEHDTQDLPGSRGARCLVFVSATMVRRVWDYPADWRDLSPAALTALSWGR